jgi:hypothetical protein
VKEGVLETEGDAQGEDAGEDKELAMGEGSAVPESLLMFSPRLARPREVEVSCRDATTGLVNGFEMLANATGSPACTL